MPVVKMQKLMIRRLTRLFETAGAEVEYTYIWKWWRIFITYWNLRTLFTFPALCNALQIPLGSKFLTDLSTFKRLHFGMLYHAIFALILILLNLILFSHYLLLNSTSSWDLTFLFIPILLSLSLSQLYWPLGTLIWPVCHSLFIPYPLSSIRSTAQLVLILCLS